jgi:hypothetical protein
MTKLQEKMAELQAEMAKLQVLENQEKIREDIAEKVQLKERLFLSLIDQPTVCRMPITSDARFKTVFNSELCDRKTCYFSDTCNQIDAVISKKGKNRKSNSAGKSAGKWSEGKSTISEKHITKGKITVKVDSGIFSVSGTEWKTVVSELAGKLAGKASNTQIGGYRHKGKAPDFPYLSAFNGTGKEMGKVIT